MVSKNFTIQNETGLHARPVGVLVKGTKNFNCDVTLEHKGKTYNAKSILNVMSACIKKNDEITINCNGNDESECLEELTKLIESGLGE